MDAPTAEKARMVRSFAIWKETVETKETDEKTNKPVLRIEPIEANAGDTICWEGDAGHAISIWFPHSGVFVTPVVAVMHEGPVEATIRDDAQEGVYEYAIYDHTEHQFVMGGSHPKIEIPKP